MGESDVVIRGKELSKKNVSIDFSDFYSEIKKYLKEEKGYTNFNEKSQEEKVKDGLKDLKVKFDAVKKVDDYTEFKLGISLKLSGAKQVKIKDKRLLKGDFSAEFDASLENDYKEKWEENVFKKFLRGVYDKIILREHFNELEENIKEDCLDTVDEIKKKLGMEK